MQPSSREMQGINSLLNPSQISLQNLHHHNNHHQIQNTHMNHNYHHHQHHRNQLNQTTTTPHFHSTPHHDDNDDFLEQMLSNLPSCSWTDLNTNKPLWDQNYSLHNTVNDVVSDHKPLDLSDETSAPCSAEKNVAFPYDEEHASLASKFRNHQISGAAPTTKAAGPIAALMLQHQQLLLSRGVASSDDSGLLQIPLSLAGKDAVDASPFKSPNPGAEASVQALYNGFTRSLHGTGNHNQHFQHPQGQSFGPASGIGGATNQTPASGGGGGGAPAQPKQRVRARRGQATDPHSIAERLRRERIAERMKALQELVPNANKTDKASMLDEIIDYVKFLQLQVKVLSMSRLGGAAAVAPLVADMSSEGGGDSIQTNGNGNGVGALSRNSNGNQTTSTSNDSLTMTEHQVAKLMEEDMGSAMQYLQGKGLCLMPISLATAISTNTCNTRNPLTNGAIGGGSSQIPTTNSGGISRVNPAIESNGEGPSSPNMSALTVQSATAGNDGAVKDAASVSKP